MQNAFCGNYFEGTGHNALTSKWKGAIPKIQKRSFDPGFISHLRPNCASPLALKCQINHAKCTFFEFSCRNIWSCQKKAVTSARPYSKRARNPPKYTFAFFSLCQNSLAKCNFGQARTFVQ